MDLSSFGILANKLTRFSNGLFTPSKRESKSDIVTNGCCYNQLFILCDIKDQRKNRIRVRLVWTKHECQDTIQGQCTTNLKANKLTVHMKLRQVNLYELRSSICNKLQKMFIDLFVLFCVVRLAYSTQSERAVGQTKQPEGYHSMLCNRSRHLFYVSSQILTLTTRYDQELKLIFGRFEHFWRMDRKRKHKFTCMYFGHLCICEIWSFYDQNCGKKDCPLTMTTKIQRQHTTDNSWMHRLIGIYANWAK